MEKTNLIIEKDRRLVSGNEAVALAAIHCGIMLATGYPGTPSTEILEEFHALGGQAQWSPNEKVAYEVALGAAYGSARALVTMKHVGLNVAADPLFTSAYTGVSAALIVVSADDPGMASSQNEQDNRRYAEAAGLPMFEPADSQEAYDLFIAAVLLSEKWQLPVLFRMTTRVCHSKTVLFRIPQEVPARHPFFEHDPKARVMIPGHARIAHRKLRNKLNLIQLWNDQSLYNPIIPGSRTLGIIASGAAFMHAREAAPDASFLKLGLTYPLPLKKIAAFVAPLERCVVLEEGDPFLYQALRAEGLAVEGKPDLFRQGELSVDRVRRILAHDTSPEPQRAPGKPPQLCPGCPHRKTFEVLREQDCIVAGDIGCYSLVLPPFEAMDTCVCMGASIGVGLGLRRVLPTEQARRVVSVIGDSTFIHSGLTGLVDMIYNPPATGHTLIILDNGTTAMTGLQEHPGTGRMLGGQPSGKISFENVALAMGLKKVHVLDPFRDSQELSRLLLENRQDQDLLLIIMRRPCLLISRPQSTTEAAVSCP
jgi:indolepyruvate ferredoxin oxidoreductase alpha subunit